MAAAIHPDRHGDGPGSAPLSLKVRDHPPALAHLDLFYRKRGKLLPAQGAAHQQSQDHVIPLAL